MVANAKSLDLVISIINYKTAQLTIDCVASVLADLDGLNAHVVVVDNASGDGSGEAIEAFVAEQKISAQVSVIRSPKNEGFSGGHNLALTGFEAECYFILNSDAIVRAGCLRQLVERARSHPEIGLFAPQLEDEDTTVQVSCFRAPTPLSELIRAAHTGVVTRLFAKHDQPLEMPPTDDEIGWASFAAILVRRDVINAVGLMDEGFFLYFEDTDYCVQLRKKGYGISYVKEARVVHFRGGSAPVKKLGAARKRLPAYYYASRTRLFYKSYGYAGLFAANVLWHFGRIIAAARVLVGGSHPKVVAHEARDIWTNFLSPLGDRKAPPAP